MITPAMFMTQLPARKVRRHENEAVQTMTFEPGPCACLTELARKQKNSSFTLRETIKRSAGYRAYGQTLAEMLLPRHHQITTSGGRMSDNAAQNFTIHTSRPTVRQQNKHGAMSARHRKWVVTLVSRWRSRTDDGRHDTGNADEKAGKKLEV
ncbi:hypothetical protein ElyMa_000865100 [Elysia marginata]|uniref:Uncharacterized protein n=1 Tax=Elysia marginata TaxID=1093978 RepID=A0AAV4H5H9_9GAST|nr:hypothetical protein ElyMa_000865100 [Elysia marginata]